MTTESDQSKGDAPAAAAQKRLEKAPVQINMPAQDGETTHSVSAEAPPQSINAVEEMLGRLLQRLDDNDRRYGAALTELNQRLNDISQRTQHTPGSGETRTGATLERLREQASSLAAQVSDAGSAHLGQGQDATATSTNRLNQSANGDRPHTDLGDARLNNNFADVTERLERSLATNTPASELDTITRHLDELGERLDTALSRNDNASALQAIEGQLRALSQGFDEARQSHARVAKIEENLTELMSWAQAGGGQATGTDGRRLDAIEQTLQALERNARDMDARTISTLEAMNEAIHSIAANSRTVGDPVAPNAAPPRRKSGSSPAGQAGAARNAKLGTRHEPDSEVWIEEHPEAEADTDISIDHAAAVEAELGASIPDYQPSPTKSDQGSDTGAIAGTRNQSGNEFMEAARRAAAAASQEPPKKSSGGLLGKRLAASATQSKADDAGKPRRILYLLAAGLMLTSAGLMYARLHKQTPASDNAIQAHENPAPPVVAPKAPTPKPSSGDRSSQQQPVEQADGTPHKHAERMQPEAQPQPEQPKTHRRPETAAAKPKLLQSNGPLSTATVLASLTPPTANEQFDGVSIDIKEPTQATEQQRHRTRPAASLVPSTDSTAAPNALTMPKRIPPLPTPAPNKSLTPDRTKVDSARADEIAAPNAAGQSNASMPPARIGPNSLRVAAARGNPAAQVEIASRYAKGTGVPQDLKKAAEWYGRAAAQSHAPAQYRLAAMFERGQGVKKDIGIARAWYHRAAELGNIRAMHNLAVLYTRDAGKGPDYDSARKWFYQAARHGLADSQYNLGVLYESGLGVRKNTAEAYKWFTLAARQGDAEAGKRREALRPGLPARSLSAVEQTIRKWKSVAPKEEANHSGPPRGGWRNAKGNISPNPADPAKVLHTQKLLNKLGYDTGAPDGKLGPKTSAAIRRFQQRSGLKQTGTVTPEVLETLEGIAS